MTKDDQLNVVISVAINPVVMVAENQENIKNKLNQMNQIETGREIGFLRISIPYTTISIAYNTVIGLSLDNGLYTVYVQPNITSYIISTYNLLLSVYRQL